MSVYITNEFGRGWVVELHQTYFNFYFLACRRQDKPRIAEKFSSPLEAKTVSQPCLNTKSQSVAGQWIPSHRRTGWWCLHELINYQTDFREQPRKLELVVSGKKLRGGRQKMLLMKPMPFANFSRSSNRRCFNVRSLMTRVILPENK